MIQRIPSFDDFDMNESMQYGSPMSEEQEKQWKQIGFDTLEKFDDICKKHKMKYYVDWGTLLGWHRDQDFLPNDGDLDVTIPIQYVTPEFLKEIKEAFLVNVIGCNCDTKIFTLIDGAEEIGAVHGLQCYLPKTETSKSKRKVKGRSFFIDLWFAYPFRGDYFVMWGNHPFKIPGKYLEKLSDVKIGSRTYKAPAPIDDYLSWLYIGTWKTPIKKFGWSQYEEKKDEYFLEDIDKPRGFIKNYTYNFKTNKYKLNT